jgi:hypothetical protein
LKYPNVLWAISQFGNRYKFAAMIGRSESWLSRRLLGRVQFKDEEREQIAEVLAIHPIGFSKNLSLRLVV